MFSGKRLTLARDRRGLTGIQLSELSGITAVTISRLESGQTKQPDDETIARLAGALRYPGDFFFKAAPEELDDNTVSFRSLKKMSAKQKNAALGAGSLGLELYDLVENDYHLPEPNVPEFSGGHEPYVAARLVRQHWGLGDRPIGNVLRLLESRGVRVLSLEESNKNVDAFSFWRKGKPFVFLNTFKTAEHSIFDCGHELGHLCLHKHAGPRSIKSAEMEANMFASSFLMPEHDVKAAIPHRLISVKTIIASKIRWKVSAMALTVRLHQLEMLSDWQYRSMCIDLGKLGYRSSEKIGVVREKSVLWQKILADLWSKKLTKEDLGKKLGFPYDEVERLIFQLAGDVPVPSPQKVQLKEVPKA
ncbi:helix-turn-helix domain-containing protein [Pararhizobium gei]|uniref:helix-turn-helix domain-containing protein n=1 Tax=Pararhizobium gei TaxID=1395951 RepID=UPI0023DC7C26|nr:ImmA/IrrE family metallo-endopeptidase [Rhizobium gei]